MQNLRYKSSPEQVKLALESKKKWIANIDKNKVFTTVQSFHKFCNVISPQGIKSTPTATH